MEYTKNVTKYLGLDTHKATVAVAVAKEGGGEPDFLGTIPNTTEAIARLVRRLGPVDNMYVCYEAGPCGYGIYRQLKEMGVACMVAAPSLIPSKPGERVKTDRRDAKKLARLLRSGELVGVWVPDEEQEAFRDLTRAREDIHEDMVRKRNQIGKFLLRHSITPPEGVKPWTCRYREWLNSVRLQQPAAVAVLREYIFALESTEAMINRLDLEIADLYKKTKLAPFIDGLQSLRGVGLITAATVVAEAGDLTRFTSAGQVMSYAGVVPSEYSSGGKGRRGAITKTGNAHVRRILIEAAWHYRKTPVVGKALKKRQEGQSERVKNISWHAQRRLNTKFRKLSGKGKLKQIAVVAVARELLGYMWSIAQEIKSSKIVG